MEPTGIKPIIHKGRTINVNDVDFLKTCFMYHHGLQNGEVLGVGFEPTRFSSVDLKSTPLDQLGHPSITTK